MAIGIWEGPYAVLSNFSAHEVEYDGVVYKTSEHAYQTAKFSEDAQREKIASAPSAFLSREYGQSKEGRTPDFDKVPVMKEIMKAKALQHEDVRSVLLATENELIEKNHPLDYFWGTGEDGSGENMMGKLWMEIRDELRTT